MHKDIVIPNVNVALLRRQRERLLKTSKPDEGLVNLLDNIIDIAEGHTLLSPARVEIEVYGGVAHVKSAPAGVEVSIFDYDDQEALECHQATPVKERVKHG